jgi:hypothetical protein
MEERYLYRIAWDFEDGEGKKKTGYSREYSSLPNLWLSLKNNRFNRAVLNSIYSGYSNLRIEKCPVETEWQLVEKLRD